MIFGGNPGEPDFCFGFWVELWGLLRLRRTHYHQSGTAGQLPLPKEEEAFLLFDCLAVFLMSLDFGCRGVMFAYILP